MRLSEFILVDITGRKWSINFRYSELDDCVCVCVCVCNYSLLWFCKLVLVARGDPDIVPEEDSQFNKNPWINWEGHDLPPTFWYQLVLSHAAASTTVCLWTEQIIMTEARLWHTGVMTGMYKLAGRHLSGHRVVWHIWSNTDPKSTKKSSCFSLLAPSKTACLSRKGFHMGLTETQFRQPSANIFVVFEGFRPFLSVT